MLLLRRVQGLALLAWLGCCYATALTLRRISRPSGQRLLTTCHRHGSRLLLGYVQRHGALLIKIGQYIASRPDIFPLAYVDRLSVLRDRVAPRPLTVLRPTLERAFEGRVDEHLPRIEHTALAAASFGQVHRAWLSDGTLVAVKIQYPGLDASVAVDLRLVRHALRLLGLLLPGWPMDLVHDEIRRVSHEEQDYLHEGSYSERLREALRAAGLHVPRVHWEHSREQVLVMQFAPGRTFAQMDWKELSKPRRRAVAARIIDGFLRMLLHERVFHADPHGGNLIYEDRGEQGFRVWLLDFGMCAEVEQRDSARYLRFLMHLRSNDIDGMADVLYDLGVQHSDVERADLRELIHEIYGQLGHLNPQTFKGSQRQAELTSKVSMFLRRCRGIAFPRHTIMLSRASSLVEGLCLELVPERNVLDLIRPRLEQYSGPLASLRRFAEQALGAWRDWQDLPDRIENALASKRDQRGDQRSSLAALLLIAALLLPPGSAQLVAASAAGLALVAALLQRR